VEGRVVLLTGGFGALGRVVGAEAVKRGAKVVSIDRAEPPPDLLHDSSGRLIAKGGLDIAHEAGALAAVNLAASSFGGLDVVLNIAGAFRWQKVADGDPAVWESLFAANTMTALQVSRAALPLLRKSGAGRIVNVGALAALNAGAGMGAYAASKASVHRLTESLAEELKDQGITVNAVLPSTIDTPANRKDMPDADPAKWVSPAELAEVILFLASAAASAVTGALVRVSGRV